MDKHCREYLKVAVGQICEAQGFSVMQDMPMNVLIEVAEKYMEDIAKSIHGYSELVGRTQPNLDDVGLAFAMKSIKIKDLEAYVQSVDQVPFAREVIAFPAPKASSLQFPNPNSREILHHRAEHIHDHLPSMFPDLEEQAVGQKASTSALTSQPEPQASNTTAPMTVGEKRPHPAPSDGPTPGKRPRVTVSSLPEEVGHSQYEMSCVIMADDGTIIGLNGKGKKAEPCLPPPSIRHSTVVPDATPGPNRGAEGSDSNKENTAVETLSTEPMRLSLMAGKEGSAVITESGSSKSKPSSTKTKNKKKDKIVGKEKEKKPKKKNSVESNTKTKNSVESNTKTKVVVGEKRPAPVSVESGSACPPKKPKLKDGKMKEKTKSKGSKIEGIKKKIDSKKKTVPSVTNTPVGAVTESASDSRLKNLLLSRDKHSIGGHSEPVPSTSSVSSKVDVISPPSPESDALLRQAFSPTDIFDSGSEETSPKRLIIAEAEGRAQEKEEEKRIRLKNIDDTISSVIRGSASNRDKETEGQIDSPPKKRGRPKKVKNIKTSKYIDDAIIKKEREDELGARNIESINDTINTVIRQGSEEPKPSPPSSPKLAQPQGSSAAPVSDLIQKPKKEGKKKKGDKDKNKVPGVKKKLKAKIQNKSDKGGESSALQSPHPPVDLKPFVSDKFSTDEMKVFEFGDTDSPPALPERRPSQAEKEPSPAPVPTTPPSTQGSFSPVDLKSVIKSPTPEAVAAAAASSASPSSAASVDHQVQPLKIGMQKDKERHKEKSRGKDHKKEKKEKRRDKEKKKKNKDKDRDRDRHDKHHHDHKHRIKEEVAPEPVVLKLKIKFPGAMAKKSPSPMIVPNNSSQEPKGIKLVIRGTGSQKKHSSVVSTPVVKLEPRNTPPTLHPASPFQGTPPPPVLSRNNSPAHDRSPSPVPCSPPQTELEAERCRSPARSASPHHEPFEYSPHSSQLRHGCSSTPPHHTVTSRSPSPVLKTPEGPGAHFNHSSPFAESPIARGSFLQTVHHCPSPALYEFSSPLHSDQSPVRPDRSPGRSEPHVGALEHGTAPSSPPCSETPVEDVHPVAQRDPTPPPAVSKPKGKIGRPRTKSPRSSSLKGRPPKSSKCAGKLTKPAKAGGTGKSAGRGRPPKAKTLALRAALAANSSEDSVLADKVKSKPPSLEVQESAVEDMPSMSPVAVEVEKSALGSWSESSPSPAAMSISSSSSRQRGATVEAETVGSYFDSNTGQQIWICPTCGMQDDGSPMIGCDKCDNWHHWVCVGITMAPPEEESWFCTLCLREEKKKAKPKGKRGRKKKGY